MQSFDGDTCLYVDHETGEIKDKNIEYIFGVISQGDSLENDVIEAIGDYASILYSDYPKPDNSVFNSVGSAISWASNFGAITIWQLDEQDYEENPELLPDEASWGCKVGPLEIGFFAAAKTLHYAVLLAVIQLFRELLSKLHNDVDSKSLH